MRSTKYFATLACAGAAVWICGCSSIEPGSRSEGPPPQNLGLTLSEEDTEFAEALAFFTQGLVHEFNHEYDQALSNYKRAVDRDPDNEELHFRIAMGLLQQKKNDEAIALMESLALRKPDSKKPRLWLALIYRATDQSEKALDTYESLIELSPQDASLYIEAASLLMREERDDEAIDVLESGLGEAEDQLQILRLLAGIHVKHMSAVASESDAADHRKMAIKSLNLALENDEEDLSTLYQLGDLYILDRNLEKAIECFAVIETKHPRRSTD